MSTPEAVPDASSEAEVEAPTPLESAARRLQPKLEEAREHLDQASERLKGFVREHPGACLAGAVALGFLLGRLASRDE